jgi:hypothetical protein
MSKIQISTIEKTANVQVIELDAKFVATVIRLQQRVRNTIEGGGDVGDALIAADEFLTDMSNAMLEEDEPSFKTNCGERPV